LQLVTTSSLQQDRERHDQSSHHSRRRSGAGVHRFRRIGARLETKYPELTFAVVPAENASGVTERWAPFVAYLSKELGVKVTLRIANDYAAVIEGQRSGNIQIASYGSASFARARFDGVKTDAFANDINSDGSTGYYSMFFVKASSAYKSIDQFERQESRPCRSEFDFRQQRAKVRARQDGHLGCRQLFRQGRLHRQPRKRHAGAGARHRRCRGQSMDQR